MAAKDFKDAHSAETRERTPGETHSDALHTAAAACMAVMRQRLAQLGSALAHQRRMTGLALVVLVLPLAFALFRVTQSAADTSVPTPAPAARGRVEAFLAPEDLNRFYVKDGEVRVDVRQGSASAVLTLDERLQRHVIDKLEAYEVPFGALVAVEPLTGRVLAYVSRSVANPHAGDLARDVSPPAASIFKLVTAAALLEAGVSPGEKTCYHDSLHGIERHHLSDAPKRDDACAGLGEALSNSTNAVFAKLALRHLSPKSLGAMADKFAFGRHVPFDFAWEPSPYRLPEDELEFARAAAGFWHTHLSPLHGATIAASIANKGLMRPPFLVAEIRPKAEGKAPLYRYRPEPGQRVLTPGTAATLGKLMEGTTRYGTAKSAFYDRQGRPFLPDITVSSKTGTLNGQAPYRGYTWWVGYAPVDNPKIAVAALVVNTPKWRIKASYLGREALRVHLRP